MTGNYSWIGGLPAARVTKTTGAQALAANSGAAGAQDDRSFGDTIARLLTPAVGRPDVHDETPHRHRGFARRRCDGATDSQAPTHHNTNPPAGSQGPVGPQMSDSPPGDIHHGTSPASGTANLAETRPGHDTTGGHLGSHTHHTGANSTTTNTPPAAQALASADGAGHAYGTPHPAGGATSMGLGLGGGTSATATDPSLNNTVAPGTGQRLPTTTGGQAGHTAATWGDGSASAEAKTHQGSRNAGQVPLPEATKTATSAVSGGLPGVGAPGQETATGGRQSPSLLPGARALGASGVAAGSGVAGSGANATGAGLVTTATGQADVASAPVGTAPVGTAPATANPTPAGALATAPSIGAAALPNGQAATANSQMNHAAGRSGATRPAAPAVGAAALTPGTPNLAAPNLAAVEPATTTPPPGPPPAAPGATTTTPTLPGPHNANSQLAAHPEGAQNVAGAGTHQPANHMAPTSAAGMTAQPPTPHVVAHQKTTSAPETTAITGTPVGGVTATTTTTTAGQAPPATAAHPTNLEQALNTAALHKDMVSALRAIQTRGNGTHHLTVRIDPEGLGPVQIRAIVGEGGIAVELSATHWATRDALRAALPDFRRDAALPGLQVDVNDTTDSQGRGGTGSGAGDLGSHGGRNEGRATAAHHDNTPAQSPTHDGQGENDPGTTTPTADEPTGVKHIDVLT